MVAGNLGVVFGPTLLKAPIPSTSLDLIDSGVKSAIIERLILHVDTFFPRI